MTEIQKQRIEHLRAIGKSYAIIADMLGLSENTIKSYCRRNNVGTGMNIEKTGAKDTCCNCGILLQHIPGAKQKRFFPTSVAWHGGNPIPKP